MSSQQKQRDPSTESDLTVVGIGASAGGLEALQEFFQAAPDKPGVAFVVIQHLSPDYKSLMDELLARHTKMPVTVAEDGMEVKKNSVYLIPPRKNLRIFHNQLFLENQETNRGLNLPVDVFFKSLANEKQNRAIGVILSGTGSDGTVGLKRIKERGGMVIAQKNATAKFDGMPQSAADTGLVDFILEPKDMPGEIIEYAEHPIIKKKRNLDEAVQKENDKLSKIILILRDYSGIDFSFYKENTIVRRIERRVSINRVDSLSEYIEFLMQSESEKDILYKELLIGVTRFFRDREAFDSLAKNVLPKIIEDSKKQMRVWAAGCSTGEEVYSLAILIQEELKKRNSGLEVKIFATDLDRQSLDIAGQAVYPDGILADMDRDLLNRYFKKREDGYQASDEIRRMVVFARHNLLKDPPFSRLDLIVCRNLFIYIKPDMQNRLLNMFYQSLNSNGYLFLGSSESIGEHSRAFKPVDSRNKIYKYNEGYQPDISEKLVFPSPDSNNQLRTTALHDTSAKQARIDNLLDKVLAEYLPPSVIIDSANRVVHIINDINPVTQVQPGKYSSNLYSILPKELGLYVSSLLRQLKRNKKLVRYQNISNVENLNGKILDLEARYIQDGKAHYYLIVFKLKDEQTQEAKKVTEDVFDAAGEDNKRIEQLENELQTTKESLQATVEELETSNEELQSSNEELIASNEELQSTNEELQSVNEELHTVNAEHQSKIEELTRLKSDVENLLRNTEVGALYLDSKLHMRKITEKAREITNLRDSDVGRPISDITVMSSYKQLLSDCQHVIDSLETKEREVSDNGHTYFVRIRPYRTVNNAVDGILLTFVDISRLKKQEEKAEVANARLLESLEMGNMAWWEWDFPSGKVEYHERKATMLGYSPVDFPNDIYEICDLIHPDDYESTMQAMRDHLSGKKKMWEATYRIRKKDGTYKWYHDRGKITQWDDNNKPLKITGFVGDVNELETITARLHRKRRLLELILENSPVATTMVDAEGHIVYANKNAEELFGISAEEIKERNYDSDKWKITDLEGKPVKSKDLPFAIIKKERKLIRDYKHYIEIPGQEKKLLNITGAPVSDEEGNFEGAVFVIHKE